MVKKLRKWLNGKISKLQDNNLRTRLLTCIFIILCLSFTVLAFFIDDWWGSEKYIYKNMIINVLNMLASIFGLSAAWEIICKRSFSREILNLGGVADNYIDSGITCVYKRFKDINWSNELKNTKEFTVFFSYGYTWRNQYRQSLEKLGKDAKFTVILPDYRDDNVVYELDKRFGYGEFSSEDDKKLSMSKTIESAAIDFENMGATVKLYNGTICTTYYLIDDMCIYAPFKHNKKKVDVPAIKCQRGGHFFEFCYDDLWAIFKEAKDWRESSNDK